MRKLLCLSAVATVAAAFVFVGPADAGKGGVPGSNKHNAFNVFVSDPIPCADDVTAAPVGTIEVGLDEPQCYSYVINIENTTAGTFHRDELPAIWDLDGDAEDAATGSGNGVTAAQEDAADAADQEDGLDGSVDGDCTAQADPDCDGDVDGDGVLELAVDGLCTDGSLDGSTSACDGNFIDGVCDDGVTCDGLDTITEVDLVCDVFESQPDSAVKTNIGNVPAKQPEFIVVEIVSIVNATNECNVRVFARTVLNPGESDPGVDDVFDCDVDVCAFEPRSCTPMREFTRTDSNGDGVADTDVLDGIITTGSGLPISLWFDLNRGVRSYDTAGELVTDGSDFVVQNESIALEPTNCDTDGDLILDVDELANCALNPDTSCTAS